MAKQKTNPKTEPNSEQKPKTTIIFDFSEESKQFLMGLFGQRTTVSKEETTIAVSKEKESTEVNLTMIREMISHKAETNRDGIVKLLAKYVVKGEKPSASNLKPNVFNDFYNELKNL